MTKKAIEATANQPTSEPTNQPSITEEFVFLMVHFGKPGNTKTVRTKKQDESELSNDNTLALTTNANIKWLKVQKTLIESKELEAIISADAKTYLALKKFCLPYDTGAYMLPNGLVPEAREMLVKYALERKALVDTYCERYAGLCEQARIELGDQHNPSDYLPVDRVQAKFRFDWELLTFEVPSKQKLGIYYGEELQKHDNKLKEVAEDIKLLMRETLLDAVKHLTGKLSESTDGKQKRLHPSALVNIQEFLRTFEFKNITNDSELASVCETIDGMVRGLDVDYLRDNKAFKEELATKMVAVTQSLETLVENTPIRRFRD